ncbi:MAG TPA: hypothetical protein VMR41_06220 [Patescibacteria group bacterium]|nr:hypothetical protein [Patescibacteria group bacterium]
MLKKLQSRNVLIAIVAVLILLVVGGGGYFFLSSHNNAANSNTTADAQDDQTPTAGNLQPSDIGLQLVLRADNQAIKFTANKLDGVKTLEWTFTYDADIPASDQTADNAGSKVTQEFGSDSPVNVEGKSSYDSGFRELGTCSSGHCRYDTGITSVSLVMKVTKTDGKVYQIQDSINLPQ